jgi:hypothetical protein
MNKYNELSDDEKAGWDKYFIEQIKKSPALQAVYEKYKFSYWHTLKIPFPHDKAIRELKEKNNLNKWSFLFRNQSGQ